MPTEKQKKGTKYENFSKEILLLEQITWDEKVKFDTIISAKKIDGKSGLKHQIDIHLTSSKYPQYHLIGECKNFNTKVEKTLTSSFVTIVNDIKDKHKEWIIIPVFLSNSGFNSGAKIILQTNKILPFYLKDVSDTQKNLLISIKSNKICLSIKQAIFFDGTAVEFTDKFINLDRGETLCLENIVGFYELLDEEGEVIDDIFKYKGYFKTGKRQLVLSQFDKFLRVGDEKELSCIEGFINGTESYDISEEKLILNSSVKAIYNESEYVSFIFNKDGTIERNVKKD